MKYIKTVLLIFLSISGITQELQMRSNVIITDKGKNKVWVQKIEDGIVYCFIVDKTRLGDFKPGIVVGVLYNAKKVIMPSDERISVTNIDLPFLRAIEFVGAYTSSVISDNKMKANNTTITIHEMTTRVDRGTSSNVILACCEKNTTKGVVFTLPETMTELSLERKLYVFDNWVFADKKNFATPSLLFYRVTGEWTDTTKKTDSNGKKTVDLNYWELDDKKAAKPGHEDSSRWATKKVNAKTNTGKLIIQLPKDVAWDMTIYASGSDKVISNTMLKTSFSLLPGSYDLEINHIKITGVKIEKGNETRLKVGTLHIANATSWTLYDQTKKTVLINSMSAQKRGLPVGRYILSMHGQDQEIEIKDGEIVEY